MRLLADTHALLWFLLGDDKLPAIAHRVMADQTNDVYVSAASAWEIATKQRIGKLPRLPFATSDLHNEFASRGFLPLSISMAHADRAGRFDDPHKDPFDRMLIAQALVENLVLVSNEAAFDRFGVRRLW